MFCLMWLKKAHNGGPPTHGHPPPPPTTPLLGTIQKAIFRSTCTVIVRPSYGRCLFRGAVVDLSWLLQSAFGPLVFPTTRTAEEKRTLRTRMTRTRLSPRARFSCDYSTGEERIGKETGSQGHVAGNDITSCAIFVSFFFGHIDVKLSFFISKPLIKHLAKRRLLKLHRDPRWDFSLKDRIFLKLKTT